MLKQRAQLRLLQKISPQQIQFIKLLQIPSSSLEMRIKEELEQNPALIDSETMNEVEDTNPYDLEQEARQQDEEYSALDNPEIIHNDEGQDKEFSLDEYLEGESDSYKTRINNSSDDDDDYEAPIRQSKSFYDLLYEQLHMLDVSAEQMTIAEHLIGSLDDDGYLRRPLPAIAHELVFRYNIKVTAEDIELILAKLQKFDPAGVGARDLKECLLLQLQRRPGGKEVSDAKAILNEYFEEFTKKHFDKIRSGLSLTEDRFRDAYSLITRLNPKPGESEGVSRHEYIIPDFILLIDNNKQIDIKLNSKNAPELRVSKAYIRMFQEYQRKAKKQDKASKEALEFIKSKIEGAKWFIDAIRQRQYTLLNTMSAIADKQREFFLSDGDERRLRPMILKDIADEIEMDISTVSRVANSKYVQTDFGIFSLKFFFTEGITQEDGSEVSNREVKRILQDLIGNEDKSKPLSDDALSDALKEKGYNIARRTVAKYREQLNIPVARLRKEI